MRMGSLHRAPWGFLSWPAVVDDGGAAGAPFTLNDRIARRDNWGASCISPGQAEEVYVHHLSIFFWLVLGLLSAVIVVRYVFV
jgi:hypothetical protein